MNNNYQRKSLTNFARDLENSLKRKVPVSSGKLKRSIDAKATDDTVEVDMLSYANIVDEGINGKHKNNGSSFSFKNKKPPISSLEGLSKRTGINVFALQNSIFENGYRASNFINKGLNNEIDDFATDYAEAVWNDFAEGLDKQ